MLIYTNYNIEKRKRNIPSHPSLAHNYGDT